MRCPNGNLHVDGDHDDSNQADQEGGYQPTLTGKKKRVVNETNERFSVDSGLASAFSNFSVGLDVGNTDRAMPLL